MEQYHHKGVQTHVKNKKNFKKEVKKYYISKHDRTLTSLSKLDTKIYIYCGDKKTLQRFIEDADNEYFHYGDGVSLFERKPSSVMALHNDRTISFVGHAGMLAFHISDATILRNDNTFTPLIKVDYRKYIKGYKDYLYQS